MPTPAPGAPDSFWLNSKEVLQSLVDDEDPRHKAYGKLLYDRSLKYFDTAAFCALPQPLPTPLIAEDFVDGTWLDKLNQFALNYLYTVYCVDS